jgi:hypothetical protein
MLLPAILFYAPLLLPLTMADFGITDMVPDQWKDVAVVNGKNSSSGVPLDMTRESANPQSLGFFALYEWSRLFKVGQQLKPWCCHNQVLQPNYQSPAHQHYFPQLYSSGEHQICFLLTTQCDVTVKNANAQWIDWYVEWGYRDGVGSDVVKIVCQNVSHTA